MNSAIHVPVFLQLVGILVIIAEIILPSGGILSILATGLFGYSLYLVFTNISASAGMAFIIADLFIVPILVYFGIKFLAKSPATLRTKLSKEDGVTAQSSDQNDYLGSLGLAITDLRPSGVATIDDQRLDVVTRGEYLEKQTEIIVIAVRGNQIVVKQKD
ncbi:NfeD family protein [Desulfosarcina sp.]|uniref:NfeD family protein n=1 Tax=Desulfosarcina sp. TaxID=2027861 RepID=UPI0029A82086|nr:NfeD family protein [Desulfosarcina sp.]MDX2451913.1 NfeD family protein [Desulfosarcina sp.]MDX2489703.1 NfeD family protein [Desulfosarcina sp.]